MFGRRGWPMSARCKHMIYPRTFCNVGHISSTPYNSPHKQGSQPHARAIEEDVTMTAATPTEAITPAKSTTYHPSEVDELTSGERERNAPPDVHQAQRTNEDKHGIGVARGNLSERQGRHGVPRDNLSERQRPNGVPRDNL